MNPHAAKGYTFCIDFFIFVLIISTLSDINYPLSKSVEN